MDKFSETAHRVAKAINIIIIVPCILLLLVPAFVLFTPSEPNLFIAGLIVLAFFSLVYIAPSVLVIKLIIKSEKEISGVAFFINILLWVTVGYFSAFFAAISYGIGIIPAVFITGILFCITVACWREKKEEQAVVPEETFSTKS